MRSWLLQMSSDIELVGKLDDDDRLTLTGTSASDNPIHLDSVRDGPRPP